MKPPPIAMPHQITLQTRVADFSLDLSLRFGAERVVLFGPSGAGKSLTLRAIAGLLRPQQGRIVVGEQCLFDSAHGINLPSQKRRIAFLMQDYALFPHLTVSQNVIFGLHGLPRAEQQQRFEEMAALLRLEGLAQRRPRELSGGQQQRVALARALVTRPRLLLLDEPFAALDTPLRARLRRELVALQHRLAFPMLLVTHDLAEAHMLADRLAVMDEGRLLQVGRPETVLQRPASQAVARFTGARNIFVGRLVRREGALGHVATRRATLPAWLPPDSPFRVGDVVEGCVRPEQIALLPPGSAAPSDEGALIPATLVERLDHGLYQTLFFHILGSQTPPHHVDFEVDVASQEARRLGVADRREWLLAVRAADVHLIGPAQPPYFEGPAPQPTPTL